MLVACTLDGMPRKPGLSLCPPQRQRDREGDFTHIPRRALCNIPDRSPQSTKVEGRQNKGTQQLPQPRGAQGGRTSEGHVLPRAGSRRERK